MARLWTDIALKNTSVIDDTNNTLTFDVGGQGYTIKLGNREYYSNPFTHDSELVDAINDKAKELNIAVEFKIGGQYTVDSRFVLMVIEGETLPANISGNMKSLFFNA